MMFPQGAIGDASLSAVSGSFWRGGDSINGGTGKSGAVSSTHGGRGKYLSSSVFFNRIRYKGWIMDIPEEVEGIFIDLKEPRNKRTRLRESEFALVKEFRQRRSCAFIARAILEEVLGDAQNWREIQGLRSNTQGCVLAATVVGDSPGGALSGGA